MNYQITLYPRVGFTKDDRVAFINRDGTGLGVETVLAMVKPIVSLPSIATARLNYSSSMDLNLPLGESISLARKGSYLNIENDELKATYRWVDGIERKANGIARLRLTLDALNSFFPTFEEGTYVYREHRDRWINAKAVSVSLPPRFPRGYKFTAIPRVDDVSEGIAVNKVVTSAKEVPGDGRRWYLVYQSAKDPGVTGDNPLTVWLIPDEPVRVGEGAWLTQDELARQIAALKSAGYWSVYFGPKAATWGVAVTTHSANGNVTVDKYSTSYAYAEIRKSGADYSLLLYRRADDAEPIETFGPAPLTSYSYQLVASGPIFYGVGTSVGGMTIAQAEERLTRRDLSYTAGLSRSIKGLDRTQSTLVRIIECPYCPQAQSANSSGGMDIKGFTYDQDRRWWRMSDLSTSFSNQIGTVDFSEMHVTAYFSRSVSPKALMDDPKLLHSDYHDLSFVYDSFVQTVPLEGIEDLHAKPADYQGVISLIFKQSNAISSSLAFEIDPDFSPKYSGAFDRYLVSSRSNELPIFTNNYLNYLRTGANFDVKNKNLTVGTSWGGAALSIAATVAATAATVATQGAAAPLSTAGTLANAIKTTASAEMSLEEKRESIKRQAASVAGANDLDLLNFYSDNKLWVVRRDPTEHIKGMLNTYFRYFGYATNRQKVPDNLASRSYYNFLQCVPKFSAESREEFGSDDIEALYAAALAEGVTYVNIYNLITYGALKAVALKDDILGYARSMENWESYLFDQMKED